MMFHRRNMDKNRPRFKADKRFLIVVALAIVFTAAVLRAPITSMGALCVEVQNDLGLSSAAMGLVTTLPLLAFAASALFMSALSERFGKSRVLAFGCTAIIIGIFLRSFAGPFGLFFGTILLGFGISSGNVLLPSVVRDNFPAHVGVMTALYTTTISVFAGGIAGLGSALVAASSDWRAVLTMVVPFAAIALLLWIAARCMMRSTKSTPERRVLRLHPANLISKHLLKQPLTWWITGLFGVQSILFFSLVAWLPAILTEGGVSSRAITTCVALFPIVGIPCTIFVPPIAQRLKRQRLFGASIGMICVVGIVALFFVNADATAIVATVIVGFALGAPFCLCMYYFGVRTESRRFLEALQHLANIRLPYGSHRSGVSRAARRSIRVMVLTACGHACAFDRAGHMRLEIWKRHDPCLSCENGLASSPCAQCEQDCDATPRCVHALWLLALAFRSHLLDEGLSSV